MLKESAVKFFTLKKAAVLLFAIYFVVGALIVKDYGVSYDEEVERKSSLSNYVYVMKEAMASSEKESVRRVVEQTPDLMSWRDRFYGTALQCVTVAVEHLRNFEMTSREILLTRHFFTFLNYFVAGICFYLILRRRFGSTAIPFFGALFFILNPRLFGESFYNIKDIPYYSWNFIASYFILRWLEPKDDNKKNSGTFLIPAAASIAVATNTRILGISLLLLAFLFSVVQGIKQKKGFSLAVRKPLLLVAATFVFYVIITPFTWDNPLKNTIDTFFHFMSFQPWTSKHFYLGQMISSDVPWHYIPVWMGVTVPVLYIIMFFTGTAATVKAAVKRSKLHLYDVYFIALFFFTLFGYILLNIKIYEGWRHAYCLLCPFLYIAALGLDKTSEFLREKRKVFKYGFTGIVAACMVCLVVWIAANHPFQFAYFNAVGSRFAEKNFTLDYWEVSNTVLIRYALANDDRDVLTFSQKHFPKDEILTEEEKKRVAWANYGEADYYLQDTRMSYKDRSRHDGYEEVYAATVDGMKISTLFKKIE